jgi:hypothetical protein
MDEGWAAAMVGELAAPLPGTARGLTVQPSQDKLLKQMSPVNVNHVWINIVGSSLFKRSFFFRVKFHS